MRLSARGAIVVEAAIVLPILLLLVFGVVGVERVLRAQAGVQAVAHDAARAAALAGDAGQAAGRGVAAGGSTAADYALAPAQLRLDVDASDFRPGGHVAARAGYTVGFGDLPLLGWARVSVRATDVQPVDSYRSFPGGRP